jgi:hypothetical protein
VQVELLWIGELLFNERFFLRRRATTADLQRWLVCCAIWVEEGAPWASLKWEEVL